MSTLTDLDAYRRLCATAEELEALAAQGCSLIAETALLTAAMNLRGMAQAVYEQAIGDRGGALDS